MDWMEIKTQDNADALMERFGGFHDGCLREAHLWTDHYVAEDLSMSCPGNLDNRIRLLIQRQFRGPASIELLFEEVTRFNLVPASDNCDSIIFEATLLVRDGTIFWSPEGAWDPSSPRRDASTWISANRLRYREVDWLGKVLRYGPKDDVRN
jgi:hypothetical protein